MADAIGLRSRKTALVPGGAKGLPLSRLGTVVLPSVAAKKAKRTGTRGMQCSPVDRQGGEPGFDPRGSPRRWTEVSEMESRLEPVGITIDENLRERLDRLARKTKVSRSEFVRSVLENALERLDLSVEVGQAWKTVKDAFGPQVQALDALADGAQNGLAEAERRLREIEYERNELLAKEIESLTRGQSAAVLEIRQRIAELDQEASAVQELVSDLRSRLAALAEERRNLVRKASVEAARLLREQAFAKVWESIQAEGLRLAAFLNSIGDFADRILLQATNSDRADARYLFLLTLVRKAAEHADDCWRARLMRSFMCLDDDFADEHRFQARLDRAFRLGDGVWLEAQNLFREDASQQEIRF